jgi:NAD-dependent SIR2 family protein deacetylase
MAEPELAVFLGAGASCSEGAPSQARLFEEFFSESFEGYRGFEPDHPAIKKINTVKNELKRFFQIFFGFDPVNPPVGTQFPTFEEALGLVDLALSRDEGFRGFEGNLTHQQWGATLRSVRNSFVFLIALILDKKLEWAKGNHKLLVKNLRTLGLLDKTAFVTFNYDILIDNAIEEQVDYFLDYGIEFENAIRCEKDQPSVSLLKLHGSLNWLYCSSCRLCAITRYDKGVVNILMNPHESRCATCNSLTVPILIPPTYFKVLSNIFTQFVWYKAEQLLKSCRTWIFCGYSFPDADMHVKYLLKKVQVNSVPPKVFIANWYEGKSESLALEESSRYQRFLGSAAKVTYTKFSFEQFATNPSILVNSLV